MFFYLPKIKKNDFSLSCVRWWCASPVCMCVWVRLLRRKWQKDAAYFEKIVQSTKKERSAWKKKKRKREEEEQLRKSTLLRTEKTTTCMLHFCRVVWMPFLYVVRIEFEAPMVDQDFLSTSFRCWGFFVYCCFLSKLLFFERKGEKQKEATTKNH